MEGITISGNTFVLEQYYLYGIIPINSLSLLNISPHIIVV